MADKRLKRILFAQAIQGHKRKYKRMDSYWALIVFVISFALLLGIVF